MHVSGNLLICFHQLKAIEKYFVDYELRGCASKEILVLVFAEKCELLILVEITVVVRIHVGVGVDRERQRKEIDRLELNLSKNVV